MFENTNDSATGEECLLRHYDKYNETMTRSLSRYVDPAFILRLHNVSANYVTNNVSGTQRRSKASHIPSLPVIELLLALIYLTIICDIIYAVTIKYIRPKLTSATASSNRAQWPKKPYQCPQITEQNGILTLDNLWKRLRAESKHMQQLNSQHRAITRNMMESRLQARTVERDRSINRTKFSYWSHSDQNIDMVRWAARISTDHDPRSK